MALIGASGAGKTTAADLILGILEPQEGTVTIDGVDIKKCMKSWHEDIGYIPQVIYLMDDNIRANVAFGIPEEEIDDAAIEKALREAQLDQFVAMTINVLVPCKPSIASITSLSVSLSNAEVASSSTNTFGLR